MTFKIYVDGVELDADRVLLPVDQGFTENADGTTARAGVIIDDPAGDLDLTSWREFVVEEDDCSDPRIFTGWVISRGISRGPYKSGASRIWNCDLLDMNQLLHFHALRGAADDAERGSETGTERLDWLMTTPGLDGLVFDNGFVMANAWEYDESDYRGQYADDVLRDIVSANTDDRWTFFLYYDSAAASGEEWSLFYGQTTSTLWTSTMAISNVIADSDATTLYPIIDAELVRDPNNQYGGVYIYGAFGRLYRTNPTTIAAMGLPVPRDGVYTSQRLINLATAERHGASYLNWHALEVDTITVTVRVPSTQVNLIKAGMRLPVRFTHLPGYETEVYTRVQNRTVTLAEDWMYDLKLTLSVKGILQSGGGDPGDFPLPAACSQETGSFVQMATSPGTPPLVGTVTLPAPPIEGNLLVLFLTVSGGGPAWEGVGGWTALPEGETPASARGDVSQILYRQVGGAESADVLVGECNNRATIIEYQGPLALDDSAEVTSTDPFSSAGAHIPSATVTPASGKPGVIVSLIGFDVANGYIPTPAMTTDAGYNERVDALGDVTEVLHPLQWVADRSETGFSGSYTPGATMNGPGIFDGHGYSGQTAVFLCSTVATDKPPAPGQWVYNEVPTPDPDGTTTTFTTTFSFADGSLIVFVDRLDQTAAVTAYDGAAGTFTLGFAPLTGELVEVTYQGR